MVTELNLVVGVAFVIAGWIVRQGHARCRGQLDAPDLLNWYETATGVELLRMFIRSSDVELKPIEAVGGGPRGSGLKQLPSEVAATLARGDVECYEFGPTPFGEER